MQNMVVKIIAPIQVSTFLNKIFDFIILFSAQRTPKNVGMAIVKIIRKTEMLGPGGVIMYATHL